MKTSIPLPPRMTMEAYAAWIQESVSSTDPHSHRIQKEREKRIRIPFRILREEKDGREGWKRRMKDEG